MYIFHINFKIYGTTRIFHRGDTAFQVKLFTASTRGRTYVKKRLAAVLTLLDDRIEKGYC